MADTKRTDPRSPRDLLMARPDGAPLPAALEPAGPEARGYPADPKPVPEQGAGRPGRDEPAARRHRPLRPLTARRSVQRARRISDA